MSKSIYDLKLHEKLRFRTADWDWCEVLRVPGGWYYIVSDKGFFVPFNNEFQNTGAR
jgi:hypothetical protein